MKKYRTSYGVAGISAIVLGEKSRGEREDIRPVEAVVLPADSSGQPVMSEELQADAGDLDVALSAARSLLSGKELLIFLVLWIVDGRRPYPR